MLWYTVLSYTSAEKKNEFMHRTVDWPVINKSKHINQGMKTISLVDKKSCQIHVDQGKVFVIGKEVSNLKGKLVGIFRLFSPSQPIEIPIDNKDRIENNMKLIFSFFSSTSHAHLRSSIHTPLMNDYCLVCSTWCPIKVENP